MLVSASATAGRPVVHADRVERVLGAYVGRDHRHHRLAGEAPVLASKASRSCSRRAHRRSDRRVVAARSAVTSSACSGARADVDVGDARVRVGAPENHREQSGQPEVAHERRAPHQSGGSSFRLTLMLT
jgi:hypothetical protein